jgi:lipopolysaccharide export system protein LptA
MLFRFLTLAVLLSFAIYWFHIRKSPEDALAYENLIQESIDLRTRRALEDKPARQKRQQVQKDIWTQNETRHFQIQSEHSDLTIAQKKDKLEAVEELKKIHCSIQNEFTLSADEGIYAYPSHQFIAQKNCRLIQNQNQIDGTRIHLDLVQEIVTYENPKGYLAAGPLNFTAKQLIWDKKAGQLHLIDDVHIDQPGQFNLIANLGTVDLNQLQPTLLTLEGNVRLISSRIQDKKSYAVADTLTYNPAHKTLLFSAANKVLFWQEGLSLSASEILIRQDQTVEGHGDVHFTFDLEEQNYIDELFKQYL